MEIDDQRFMALEGTRTWASGTVHFAAECDRFLVDLSGSPENLQTSRRTFEVNRHCFLIAAFKLLEHAEWAVQVGALDADLTAELNIHAKNIKRLRDLNEHKLEYFTGGGRRPAIWNHEEDGGIADASSTIDTRIGNLLDWRVIARIAADLNEALP
ncbi:MAG: hypothetical protein EOS30_03625 [Mesorhizobium sp.]|nr:hypothetical protein EN746_16625 [Mesorhizobium sp. M8A.F.Ca.ET.023.02.2.1]RWC80198.1 MAG: hypothetical protein EOS30_03625 [Mesorhizobium sp.]